MSTGITVARPFAFRAEPGLIPKRNADLVRELLVERADRVAADTLAITLVNPDGGPLPTWRPGAHIDVLLDNGLERQYSLCGAVDEPFQWQSR